MEMKNQIAVVTGAAQGIGLAVASLLARRGVRVAGWDIDGELTAAMAGLDDHCKGVGFKCDITDYTSVKAAYADTCDRMGTPTILVNSAGIAGPNAPVEAYDLEAWHRVIDINLNGTFYVNKICVPGMRAQGYGRILNSPPSQARKATPTHRLIPHQRQR